MNRFLTVGVALAALGVAGCSQDPGKREAGNWKTEITYEKFDIEGMPPELKAAMAERMTKPQVVEECLTKEQAEKEDIANDVSKASGGGQCEWAKKQVSGGKIDIAGTCTGPTGEKQELTMAGTVGAKKTDIRLTMKGKAPMGGGNMEAAMRAVGTLTGPCKS